MLNNYFSLKLCAGLKRRIYPRVPTPELCTKTCHDPKTSMFFKGLAVRSVSDKRSPITCVCPISAYDFRNVCVSN
jgi:hypothetical protein